MIKPWFENYGLPSDMSLPQVGFIVEDLAVGFLRRIEGGYGLFDGLMANPYSMGKQRSLALDLVVKRLIDEARHLYITKILALTVESAILRRSLKHGFELQPDKFIALKV